ncbi:MAG TPA: transcription termination/antitermination NusG family protein [Bryobacteraceae bacterium]|nr:transcription termination/antitermination NusG family protein [Bryobacteraceae bacterium]
MSSGANKWYALKVDSRKSKAVAFGLRERGFNEYLPLCRVRRRWSDRVKELDEPLFPGYMFCRFDPLDRRVPVLTTPGVMSIVGAGRMPVPVPDEEIEAVKTTVESGLAIQPHPFVGVGSKVCLREGPLAGLEGIVVGGDEANQLVVSVTLLQRSIAVTIQANWIRCNPQTGAYPRHSEVWQRDRLQAA